MTETAAAQPRKLLIYETINPVSTGTHADISVKTGEDYAFARSINAAPLVLSEFTRALDEYPIVFTETTEGLQPTVILGVRKEENLYVEEDGSWEARYIPAFIRRYPFVFAGDRKQSQFHALHR